MSIFFYNKQDNILYQKIYESLPYINILTNINDILLADVFIYNISYDSLNDENTNVIINNYQKENIIILLDQTTKYKIPSMLNNYQITYYDPENDNFFVPIINKIKEKIINKEYYYYKYL
jgi:hypothetical protein